MESVNDGPSNQEHQGSRNIVDLMFRLGVRLATAIKTCPGYEVVNSCPPSLTQDHASCLLSSLRHYHWLYINGNTRLCHIAFQHFESQIMCFSYFSYYVQTTSELPIDKN